jgi:hypothetical protein
MSSEYMEKWGGYIDHVDRGRVRSKLPSKDEFQGVFFLIWSAVVRALKRQMFRLRCSNDSCCACAAQTTAVSHALNATGSAGNSSLHRAGSLLDLTS